MFVAMLGALGTSLSILAFLLVLESERNQRLQDFEFKAAGRIAALQAETVSNLAVLHSLHSLYSASETVSAQEFALFTQNEFATHPARSAIHALEWIPLITADERDSFEESLHAEGFSGFEILERQPDGALTTATDRPEYFPVTYIEPYRGNESALGFDLASNPSRHAALNMARDTGEPAATERIVLLQEVEDQFGFLVFVPIYQQGLPASTVQERRDALAGFVLGVFRIGDLLSSAWQNAGLQEFTGENNLVLFDRSASEGSQSLLIAPGEPDDTAIDSGRLAFTGSFNIGGRTWETTLTAPKQSLLTIWQPWSALLAGLSLTIIVLVYLVLAIQRESKTQRLVEQRTSELSETNQQLEEEVVDRSKAQRELAGLYEISRIFSAEGAFEAKATDALQKLAVLANGDWVTLRLPNAEEPGLHLVAASGPAVAEHEPIPVFTEAMTISTRAFAGGSIMVIDDYAAQPTASQALIGLGMQSMVILPVKSNERTLGLVTVISKDKNHFDAELVDLLATVGEGLGVLLDNSLLHEETERHHRLQRDQAEENAVMAEIGCIIGSSLDMEEVFEIFARQTRSLIPFDQLEITVIDEARQQDEVAFSTAPSGSSNVSSVEIPLEGTLTGRMASSRTGLIIQGMTHEEIESEYPCLSEPLHSGLRSWLTVPLVSRDLGIGALFIASKTEMAFKQNDLNLAIRVGNQIAGAISNAHQFSERKQMEQEASVLANLGRIVNSSLLISEVYETFGEEIRNLIPFDRMSLSFADYENETMSQTMVIGTDIPGLRMGDNFPMNKSLAGHVVRTKAPYMLDADTEPDLEERFPGLLPVYKSGAVSFMAVPLISRDLVVGVLRVGSNHKGIYTEKRLELLERMGNQIAGAIDNADLYARQREAEEAVREREARLRGIVESAADGIITIDSAGVVESLNAGAEAIFGYTSAEIVGQNVKMLMPEPYHFEHDGYLRANQATGGKKIIGMDREVVGRKKDGTTFPMDLSVSEVDLVNGKLFTGIVRDITERKALQQEIENYTIDLENAFEQLKTLDKMKDEFISTVSHELRTPLTSIKGAAEILLTYKDEDPATQEEFLSIINSECDRLTRLLNDVLDLSRMESGRMQWRLSEVDLGSVIKMAAHSTYAIFQKKSLTVEILPNEGLPEVTSDPDKLIQVMTNLLSNAIKFTPASGIIRVGARVLPRNSLETGACKVEISVSDNGIGIPGREFEKIFNRFHQVSTTLSDKPKGTGLGLPICKEIVEHLGGAIWVESQPGEGSTFYFTVPVDPDPEQLAGESEIPERLKVLSVNEDSG